MPLQIESVATRFRGRARGGFNNEEVHPPMAGGSEGPRASSLRQAPRLLQMC